MSSHHIVRDEQEPALLIDDSRALSRDFVDLLLEWSPTVIVTEKALEGVLSWGVKIDVVVSRMSKLTQLKTELKGQSPVQLLGFESDDLLSCAYIFLIDNGHHAVNVLANIYDSKAMDLVYQYAKTMDSLLFFNDQKWIFAREGAFQKWVTTGHVFGIHPISANTFFTSQGFYNDWQNQLLMEPIELCAELTGKVSLKTSGEPFWIVETVALEIYR